MAGHTVYTLSQVAQHKSKKDCWLVIDGRVTLVHNVTELQEEHPGGEEALIEWAGKDATQAFNDIGHSKLAHKLLLKYRVGIIQGYTTKNDADVQVASTEEPKKNEMSAFVIKDDHTPKYAALSSSSYHSWLVVPTSLTDTSLHTPQRSNSTGITRSFKMNHLAKFKMLPLPL